MYYVFNPNTAFIIIIIHFLTTEAKFCKTLLTYCTLQEPNFGIIKMASYNKKMMPLIILQKVETETQFYTYILLQVKKSRKTSIGP